MCSLRKVAPHEVIDGCRSCSSADLKTVVDFGTTPIADRLVRRDETGAEFVAQLTFVRCQTCGLCQIRETVNPAVLFGDNYPYYSSVSPALVNHFATSAQIIIERFGLGKDDLVVEPGSNDGYMLKEFFERGIPVLGIDPALGPVSVARKRGVETIHDFFTKSLAEKLVKDGYRASIVLANNVLGHVSDPSGFVQGVEKILTDEGAAILEFPYLRDLVNQCAFDTIYHQHLLYLTISSTRNLLEANGLFLNDAERTKVHGGSLRVTATKSPWQSKRLERLSWEEQGLGMGEPGYFKDFCEALERMKAEMRKALDAFNAQGLRVFGYGAAAKATTLMHYFGITHDDIECILDKSAWKQGLAMPCLGIPVAAPSAISKGDRPDVVIIFAWNFAKEIIEENPEFLSLGGKFMVPIPNLREVCLTDPGMAL